MVFKKVLIDANICIDAALYRKPFVDNALKIIERSQFGDFSGIVAAHSFDTIFYLLRSDLSNEQIYNFFRELRKAFDVADVSQSVIDNALRLNWPDFEDAIHYEAARLAGCQAIITRNGKDFSKSELPILSPNQFLKQLP